MQAIDQKTFTGLCFGILVLILATALTLGEPLAGFANSGWKPRVTDKESKNALEDSRMVLYSGGFLHPKLRGGELQFDVSWEEGSRGGLSLALFADGSGQETPVVLSFSSWAGRVWVEARAAETSFGGQDTRLQDEKLAVRVIIAEEARQLTLMVNGDELLQVALLDAIRISPGLQFDFGTPYLADVDQLGPVTISQFKLGDSRSE